jgi:peptidoglycan/xylan/chitin deacetylase (PgdA/CDA1 family)
MYHRVSHTQGDALTVTCEQLETQLRWLHAEGFTFITGAQLLNAQRGGPALSPHSVLVTFDDAYVDTLTLAAPILMQQHAPAIVFVPTAYIEGTSQWDTVPQPLLSVAQLQALARNGWEIGYHSHQHANYAQLTSKQRVTDLEANATTLQPLHPIAAFAYPYGKRPESRMEKKELYRAFKSKGIDVAFRIGNRINSLPLRNEFEINRLGVRGDRSFSFFQRQLWWGRWW